MKVVFELGKEGQDKITYREVEPGGVVGNLYFSRLACHFLWNRIPERIEIEVREVKE